MANGAYLYDAGTNLSGDIYPKFDNGSVVPGQEPESVAASDWNQLCSNFEDVRYALRTGKWIGFSVQSSDPAPAGISSYLWVRNDNAWIHNASGVNRFFAVGPVTAKGDLLVFNGTAFVVLPRGANNQVLTADVTQASGLKWATPAGGGGYQTIQGNGVAAAAETILNFSAAFTVADNPGSTRTDISPVFGASGGQFAQGNDSRFNPVPGTLGSILYDNGTSWTSLVGSIVSSKRFLTQTGTGAVSAAPAWSTIAQSDLPVMTGASGVAAGAQGAVPQPAAGQNLMFLRGDGTWAAAGGGSYQTVQLNTVAQTQRGNLNFTAGFTATDDGANNRTTIGLVLGNSNVHAKFTATGLADSLISDDGIKVTLTQPVRTTGSPNAFQISGGAHTTLTASTEATDVLISLNRTVQFSNGGIATQRAMYIQAPTYAFVSGSQQISEAITLSISGPPTAGSFAAAFTRAAALKIESGQLYLPLGSNSAPSLAFLSGGTSLTTGIYSDGSSIFFAQAGAQMVSFNSSNGVRVGSSPTTYLGTDGVYGTTLNGTNLKGALAQNSASTDVVIGSNTAQRGNGYLLKVQDPTNVLMSIDNMGAVVWTLRINQLGTNNTASAEVNDFLFGMNRTATWSTGSLTTQRFAYFRAPTVAFAGASTLTNTATVAIENAPQVGSNATITNSYALWVQAGKTRFDGVSIGIHYDGKTITWASGGGAGQYTFGTGAGTSPSGVTVVGSDEAGSVTFTAGTTPSASQNIITIQFNAAFTNAPIVIIQATNANADGLSGVLVTSTTSSFTIIAGAGALTQGQAYSWNWHVKGYQS